MTETLDTAIAAVATLPAEAQDRIGRELIRHVERLHTLRAELDQGLASLARGEGESLDIDAFLRSARHDADR